MRSPGILAIALIALARLAAAGPPELRLVEAGQDGVLYDDSIPVLDLDLITDEPFDGTLVASLRFRSDGDEAERVTLPLRADVGTQRVMLRFSVAPYRSTVSDTSRFAWELRGKSGERVAQGVADMRSIASVSPLLITTTPGPGLRRAPARLEATAHRLLDHSCLVISGDDIGHLAQRQITGLLDAVTLGCELVITGPPLALPEPLASLEHESTLAWQDDGGRSLSEVHVGGGHVRFTTLDLEEVAGTPASAASRLAMHPWSLAPRVADIGTRADRALSRVASSDRVTANEALWTRVAPMDPERVAWRGAAVSLATSILGLAAFLLLARNRRWPLGARGAIAGGAMALLAIPTAGALLARIRTTDPPTDWRVTIHDIAGHANVRYRSIEATTQGGFDTPEILVEQSARSVVSLGNWGSRWRLGPGSAWTVTSSPLANAVDQDVGCRISEAMPGTRSWTSDLHWDGTQIAGSIIPTSDFAEIVLVVGSAVIPLGSVKSGTPVAVGDQLLAADDTARARLTTTMARAIRVSLATRGNGAPWRGSDHVVLIGLSHADERSVDLQPIGVSGPPPPSFAWFAVGGWISAVGDDLARVEVPALSRACESRRTQVALQSGLERIDVRAMTEDLAAGICVIDVNSKSWGNRLRSHSPLPRPITLSWLAPAPETTP